MERLVTQATKAFLEENYITSEKFFTLCEKRYGANYFSANRKIIQNRIVNNFHFSKLNNEQVRNDPHIYYCIPVMNRLSDIQATLGKNLKVIKEFQNITIIINLFDKDDTSFQWIKSNFKNEIDAETLLVNKLAPLRFWHFSWAKNSFKAFIDDNGIYSSLDGDNHLTIDEVARTKQIFKEFGDSVIHHFSGTWGDGSSGRVSVPASLYKKHGYMDELFPRQFDEMSLILGILKTNNDVKFFCRENASIFEKSQAINTFKQLEHWNPNITNVNLGEFEAPNNPKTPDYVNRNEKMELFTKINSNFTLLKLSKSESSIKHFSTLLKKAIKDAIHSPAFLELSPSTVISVDNKSPAFSDEITLYSVVKNDEIFLTSWLNHYRELGVKRFMIVDDGSKKPLTNQNLGSDVYIFKPVVGDFKNFKVFWLMCIMRQFQKPGSLCLCADADEYIDLPNTHEVEDRNTNMFKLSALIKNSTSLKKHGRVPGLLIDLMPKDSSVEVSHDNFLDTMCYHPVVDLEEIKSHIYMSHPSIKWAFKDYWKLPYKYDLRFHMYETFDCLRKFPVFIYSHKIELNQGFHDLVREGKSDSIQISDEMLPIRHYKMLKVIQKETSNKTESFSGYFNRTAENLKKIYSTETSSLFHQWEKIKKQKYIPKAIRPEM